MIDKETMGQSEQMEKDILGMIMDSDLSYWESLGMLEHIKQELHRMVSEQL